MGKRPTVEQLVEERLQGIGLDPEDFRYLLTGYDQEDDWSDEDRDKTARSLAGGIVLLVSLNKGETDKTPSALDEYTRILGHGSRRELKALFDQLNEVQLLFYCEATRDSDELTGADGFQIGLLTDFTGNKPITTLAILILNGRGYSFMNNEELGVLANEFLMWKEAS